MVVPNASESVRSAVKSPPPRRGYVVEMSRALEAGVNPKMEEDAVMFSLPPVPEV